jgi:hypothetical protein
MRVAAEGAVVLRLPLGPSHYDQEMRWPGGPGTGTGTGFTDSEWAVGGPNAARGLPPGPAARV